MRDIFSDILRRREGGSREAVLAADRLTYDGLLEAVEIASQTLVQSGVGTLATVGLALPQSRANIVAILAIRRVGAVVVPVNYRAPSTERDYILSNAAVRHFIGPANLPTGSTLLQPVDTIDGAALYETSVRDDASLRDGDAVIIHTSGSTARPKGVVLTTEGLSANVAAVAKSLELTQVDRCVLLTPPSFAYAFSQILTHLWVGGSLLPWPHGTIDIASLLRGIEQNGITGLQANPTIFELILTKSPEEWPNVSSVRYVMSGGQPLYSKLVRELQRRFPKARVAIMYGLTENGPRASFGWLPAPVPERCLPWPVGRAVLGTQIRIKKPDGRHADVGETGEIEVAGQSLMRTYLNQSSEADDRLERGWFKTRDTGFFDENGDLNIVGRLDNIFSVGHEKVSPEEIEDTLSQLPSIEQVAVSSVSHELLGAVPVVLYVSQIDIEADIRAACSRSLSRAKFPRHVVRVPDLPRTPYGKLDRRALQDFARREVAKMQGR